MVKKRLSTNNIVIGVLVVIIVILAIAFFSSRTPTETPKETDKTKVIKSCDDSNPCTEDTFNELTDQCQYKTLATCCGNGKCEDKERCDLTTYQTKCPQDCPYECPAHTIVEEFTCGTLNCEKTAEDRFIIRGSTFIKALVQNKGEAGAAISSQFKCGVGETTRISRDGDDLFGITFRDSFGNNNDDLITLSGHQSETSNDKTDYKLKFDIDGLEKPTDLSCKVSLQDVPELYYTKTVKLSFR